MVKIGPNEKTGMNTFFKVNLNKKTYSDDGLVYMVSINKNQNGVYIRSMMAIKNNYYGYKNKKDAMKLFKEVVHVIKNTGSEEQFEQHGPTRVKD